MRRGRSYTTGSVPLHGLESPVRRSREPQRSRGNGSASCWNVEAADELASQIRRSMAHAYGHSSSTASPAVTRRDPIRLTYRRASHFAQRPAASSPCDKRNH